MELLAVFTDDLRPHALWGYRAQGSLTSAGHLLAQAVAWEDNQTAGVSSKSAGPEGSLLTQRNTRPRMTFPSHRLKKGTLPSGCSDSAWPWVLSPSPCLAAPASIGISSTQPAKCRRKACGFRASRCEPSVSTLHILCFKNTHLEHSRGREDEPRPPIINSLSFL